MIEDYCSYEVANLLKEKGFDEKCPSYYSVQDNKIDLLWNHFKGKLISNSELNQYFVSAPTHQMAMKWLRENKGLFINIGQSKCMNAPIKYRFSIDCIKFKPVAKRWRDSNPIITGYYILHYPDASGNYWEGIYGIFATEKHAKSALAMAQISQIIANDERFGGVVTDEEFENENIWTYSINRNKNKIEIYQGTRGIDHFLSFHTPEQRDLFLEENEDLIKDYLMVD